MRVVLDTNVIVAAMRSPKGSSAALLMSVYAQETIMLCSVPLAIEYEATCKRPEHGKAAQLSSIEVDQFVRAVVALVEPIAIHYLWRPQLRDAKDEMVLETAVNGQADAIVTFNIKDFRFIPAEFGIRLLLPSEAIKEVKNG
jgi:putative PIN family toxin of toxin-antitoxin system